MVHQASQNFGDGMFVSQANALPLHGSFSQGWCSLLPRSWALAFAWEALESS